MGNAASFLSGNYSRAIRELAAMGFLEAEVRYALRVNKGNKAQAAEWLLIHGSPVGTADAELQRAIQASLLAENNQSSKSRQRIK